MEYRECSYGECGNPVFARAICRKHYERERLAKAAPCSIEECNAKASKRGMCESHYQAWRIAQSPMCKIENCSAHSKGKKYGLCRKHELRFLRHGSMEQPRANDWGSRTKHSLYQIWFARKRYIDYMCDEWSKDFWVFVDVVGPDKPGNHSLRRKDYKQPLGPDNWFWKEGFSNKDKPAYARKWRATNARKAKNSELKRRFGITIDDYDRMFEEQGGVCKICEQLESSLQRDGSPSSLCVDHCHETRKVRGLLCHNCNRSLGLLKDNADVLRKAAEYLDAS